jgi:hypothetical protein
MDDLFDKNYIQRHDEMMQDSMVRYSNNQNESYKQIAQELSWIDREENGYFIMVPKSIESFKYEGMQQHNCVFACEYFNDVIARRSIIVFLRKEKTTSFVTIEFDYITFKVRQAFGKYNQKLEKELFDYIVDLGKRLNVERLSLQ